MHPACHSMQVLFMTDGKPSDPVDARVLPGALAEALRVLHEACPKVSVQLLGFGEADTRTLEAMVAALPGGVASCNLVRNDVATLQQSVSTFSNSVSVSRISSVANYSGPRRPLRRINRSLVERREVYTGCEVYLPPKKLGSFEGELRRLPKLHEIEISNRLFGYGGERNAYEARVITDDSFTSYTMHTPCTCTYTMHASGALHHGQRLHLAGRGVDRQGVSLREDPRGGGPLPPQVTHHAEVGRDPALQPYVSRLQPEVSSLQPQVSRLQHYLGGPSCWPSSSTSRRRSSAWWVCPRSRT